MIAAMPALASIFVRRCAFLLAQARAALPTDCPLCHGRAHGGRLCPDCETSICWQARTPAHAGLPWRCRRCALPLTAHDQACPDCADRDTAFDQTIIAFDYIPPADALILQMKTGHSYVRADLLGNLLAEAVRHHERGLHADTVLVPVPASVASLRTRGFNPAREVARAASRDLGLPVQHKLVWRTREQDKQSTLGRAGRRRAVQGLYACAPNLRGLRVGLVDDVMTTGSTMHAIAELLKQSGAIEVTALAVGRTPHAAKSIKPPPAPPASAR